MKNQLIDLIRRALETAIPGAQVDVITIERPKQSGHGDFSTNVAMQLAKAQKKNPREIAQALVSALPASFLIEKAEIAGAGFINFFVNASSKLSIIQDVLNQAERFGCHPATGNQVQVEFVSANPTGPLHVGHGRGAAYGASLANILVAAGEKISREYYVNDAGRQMDILALSTWLRYLELFDIKLAFPPNAYQGAYVRDMAQAIRNQHGIHYLRDAHQLMAGVPSVEADPEAHLDALIANAKSLLGEDYSYVHHFALTEQLGDCRDDLGEFGVSFDSWFSERSLFDCGLVERAISCLQERGHLYEQDGAQWFKSTDFGDEKDRVVRRENGQYTYFASDIAYHLNKFERGFDRVINIWGADHHGYIPRVKGALAALGLDADKLAIALVQFAVLYRDGAKTSMSTRSGEFVTLRELRHEVGNDAARFFYVLRKSDQHLDFDLDLAKSQSNDNPVYYIQYAHARVCSVLAQWDGNMGDLNENVVLAPLVSDYEMTLVARMQQYPDTVQAAARDMAPHLVAYYLRDLAGEFHSYYNAEQFLVPDESLKMARLALITAVRQILRNGLALLGVGCPEKM